MSDDRYISAHGDLQDFRESMNRKVQERGLQEREARGSSGFRTDVHSQADGSMSATISADSKALTEDAINQAIRSLGDRRGDSPSVIAEKLQSELNAKGTGLNDETLAQISERLATGEDVVISIGRKER